MTGEGELTPSLLKQWQQVVLLWLVIALFLLHHSVIKKAFRHTRSRKYAAWACNNNARLVLLIILRPRCLVRIKELKLQ